MPRMNAVNVEFVAREVLSVVLGIRSESPVMSGSPFFSSAAPEKALTEAGTSCSSSSRRRAVTTIWSPEAVAPVACACAGSINTPCDKASATAARSNEFERFG